METVPLISMERDKPPQRLFKSILPLFIEHLSFLSFSSKRLHFLLVYYPDEITDIQTDSYTLGYID